MKRKNPTKLVIEIGLAGLSGDPVLIIVPLHGDLAGNPTETGFLMSDLVTDKMAKRRLFEPGTVPIKENQYGLNIMVIGGDLGQRGKLIADTVLDLAKSGTTTELEKIQTLAETDKIIKDFFLPGIKIDENSINYMFWNVSKDDDPKNAIGFHIVIVLDCPDVTGMKELLERRKKIVIPMTSGTSAKEEIITATKKYIQERK